MKTFRWLRIIIVASWALIVLGLVLDAVLETRLPEILQHWNRSQLEAAPTAREFLLYGIGAIALLANLVGAIALFNRRRWGARTFLISSAFGALTMLGSAPTVTHPVAETVFEVQLVLEGLIIGLAFFSDALDPDDGLPENVEETFT